MKQFTTAVKDHDELAIEGATPIVFTVDGFEITATPPTKGQMFMIFSHIGSADEAVRVRGTTKFMDAVLDARTQRHLTARLESRDDPFEVEDLQEIVSWLLDEWSNPPDIGSADSGPEPTPSAGSSSSQGRSGRKSTAKRPSKE